MQWLVNVIEQHGLGLVFLNVLIEQLGAPIPAYPTLVVTSALAHDGRFSLPGLLALAVLGALIADVLWFYAGRRYGRRVMATMCRISLSPDSCVRQTEAVYLRWGARSLLVAKFIPGFASVASAMAGALGTSVRRFIWFDMLGAAIWVGSALLLGSLFSSAIGELLDTLDALGRWGLLILAVALILFVARKAWQRHVFLKTLKLARISVDELYELIQAGAQPLILDVRSEFYQAEGRIPGAVALDEKELSGSGCLAAEHGHEVIVYCSCPNDASAARVAQRLKSLGYTRVRPLSGGIDAWVQAGHPLDQTQA